MSDAAAQQAICAACREPLGPDRPAAVVHLPGPRYDTVCQRHLAHPLLERLDVRVRRAGRGELVQSIDGPPPVRRVLMGQACGRGERIGLALLAVTFPAVYTLVLFLFLVIRWGFS